jgi:hypothetical protein
VIPNKLSLFVEGGTQPAGGRAGLEPQTSRFLPLKNLGLQSSSIVLASKGTQILMVSILFKCYYFEVELYIWYELVCIGL